MVALLLMRGWLGHATLDIQLHNTYFVLRAVDMAGPLATAVALVAAVGRLISSRWRTPYTVAALVALAATWLLFVALGFWWLGSGLRR